MNRRGNEILGLNLRTLILLVFNVALLILIVWFSLRLFDTFLRFDEEHYRAKRNLNLLASRIELAADAKEPIERSSVILNLPLRYRIIVYTGNVYGDPNTEFWAASAKLVQDTKQCTSNNCLCLLFEEGYEDKTNACKKSKVDGSLPCGFRKGYDIRLVKCHEMKTKISDVIAVQTTTSNIQKTRFIGDGPNFVYLNYVNNNVVIGTQNRMNCYEDLKLDDKGLNLNLDSSNVMKYCHGLLLKTSDAGYGVYSKIDNNGNVEKTCYECKIDAGKCTFGREDVDPNGDLCRNALN